MGTVVEAVDEQALGVPARLVVVMEDELARTGLCAILASIAGVEAVVPCATPAKAVAALAAGEADALVCGPGAWPLLTASGHPALWDGIRVLHLVERDGLGAIDAAGLQPGHGFLMRGATNAKSLRDALARLSPDQVSMPTDMARALMAAPHPGRRRRHTWGLNAREEQVLALLAQGLSNRQIARRLTISEHGVKRHVTHLLAKMQVPNRTTAAALALREDLVRDCRGPGVPAARSI